MKHDQLLEQQMAYYRARANEYDEWFFRQGRYDRGEKENAVWFEEVARVRAALNTFAPAGQVLELACGTGIWTEQVVQFADQITAVDASTEMIALNQARLPGKNIQYIQANLFDWQPDQIYDVVFFSFWLSHVPPERFEAFWEVVQRSLKENGRVFIIDSLYEQTSTAKDHHLRGTEATVVTRLLNDGREFEIVKVFYKPDSLSERLQNLGWRVNTHSSGRFFIYGELFRLNDLEEKF
jgi:ubiquinone/menaquinone biosynthesis C-methylase UbiE